MHKFYIITIMFFSNLLFSQPVGEGARKTISTIKVDFNTIYNEADQLPEFSLGGMLAFRNAIIKNFNEKKITGVDLVRTEITFYIERDGTINTIRAKGPNTDFNREVTLAVSAIKEKWIPAKINGEKVRFILRVPFTMRFK